MKIYNEITLAWNESTQRYDTVLHEDSFEYDGPLMLAIDRCVSGDADAIGCWWFNNDPDGCDVYSNQCTEYYDGTCGTATEYISCMALQQDHCEEVEPICLWQIDEDSGGEEYYKCIAGTCVADANGAYNSIEDCLLNCSPPPTIYGCTNPNAYNYNSDATEDDGSCIFPDYVVELVNDWNIVSSGLTGEVDYPELFPEAITGTLYGFNTTYEQLSELEPGKGYWIRFDDAHEQPITGTVTDTVTVDLGYDWNLIGGPGACTTTLNDIIDDDGILIPGTMFGFNGTYYQTDEFMPGIGYWIRTSNAGTITIPCPPPPVYGCMDIDACNYSENATVNDGSCEYPLEYRNCAGNCFNDSDGDGLCDEEDDYPDCAENWEDQCGVCAGPGVAMGIGCDCDHPTIDEDCDCWLLEEYCDCSQCPPQPGCTDSAACNYNGEADEDNDTCWYVGDSPCTCSDGADCYPGCHDSDADNYDQNAYYHVDELCDYSNPPVIVLNIEVN